LVDGWVKSGAPVAYVDLERHLTPPSPLDSSPHCTPQHHTSPYSPISSQTSHPATNEASHQTLHEASSAPSSKVLEIPWLPSWMLPPATLPTSTHSSTVTPLNTSPNINAASPLDTVTPPPQPQLSSLRLDIESALETLVLRAIKERRLQSHDLLQALQRRVHVVTALETLVSGETGGFGGRNGDEGEEKGRCEGKGVEELWEESLRLVERRLQELQAQEKQQLAHSQHVSGASCDGDSAGWGYNEDHLLLKAWAQELVENSQRESRGESNQQSEDRASLSKPAASTIVSMCLAKQLLRIQEVRRWRSGLNLDNSLGQGRSGPGLEGRFGRRRGDAETAVAWSGLLIDLLVVAGGTRKSSKLRWRHKPFQPILAINGFHLLRHAPSSQGFTEAASTPAPAPPSSSPSPSPSSAPAPPSPPAAAARAAPSSLCEGADFHDALLLRLLEATARGRDAAPRVLLCSSDSYYSDQLSADFGTQALFHPHELFGWLPEEASVHLVPSTFTPLQWRVVEAAIGSNPRHLAEFHSLWAGWREEEDEFERVDSCVDHYLAYLHATEVEPAMLAALAHLERFGEQLASGEQPRWAARFGSPWGNAPGTWVRRWVEWREGRRGKDRVKWSPESGYGVNKGDVHGRQEALQRDTQGENESRFTKEGEVPEEVSVRSGKEEEEEEEGWLEEEEKGEYGRQLREWARFQMMDFVYALATAEFGVNYGKDSGEEFMEDPAAAAMLKVGLLYQQRDPMYVRPTSVAFQRCLSRWLVNERLRLGNYQTAKYYLMRACRGRHYRHLMLE
ncbi:unnamed protein product, partial [Closterium sp. NIES-54]